MSRAFLQPMGKVLFRPKNRYQQMIAEMKIRRENLRAAYGITSGFRKHYVPKEAIDRLYRMTHNIEKWTRRIKAIEKKEAIMIHAAHCIEEYFNIKVQNSFPAKGIRVALARRIFAKYCMEHKVQGIYVSWFVGAKDDQFAAVARMRLTKEFKTNHKVKALYHQFKQYVHDHCTTE